eukprot:TRINITY_DN16928_c0_g1_i1.p1 TRINITY_DN16928_c0_g1~~TRINITY_DN16928_c0_g1_i1.p1  ORF type:complete len:178 (-),score=18.01 TRINITY_DN16928_c0_g1_i1:203-736(-)
MVLVRDFNVIFGEVRNVLTGSSFILSGVLLIPFQARFSELSNGGKATWMVAALSCLISMIFLISPALFHSSVGSIGIRPMVSILVHSGYFFLAIGIIAALGVSTELALGETVAWIVTPIIFAFILTLWVAVPTFIYCTVTRKLKIEPLLDNGDREEDGILIGYEMKQRKLNEVAATA